METKYSLFGNFKTLHEKIKEIDNTIDKSFKRELSNTIVGGVNQQQPRLAPLYSFKGANVVINIGEDRIDFIYNNEKQIALSNNDFELLNSFLPETFNRVAININNGIKDKDQAFLRTISSKTPFGIQGTVTNEIFFRKNQVTMIEDFLLNNVITIQNGLIKTSEEFTLVMGIVYSFDINTVINGKPIAKNICCTLFEKMGKLAALDETIIKDFLN